MKKSIERELRKAGYTGAVDIPSLVGACGNEWVIEQRKPNWWSAGVITKYGTHWDEVYGYDSHGRTIESAVAGVVIKKFRAESR